MIEGVLIDGAVVVVGGQQLSKILAYHERHPIDTLPCKPRIIPIVTLFSFPESTGDSSVSHIVSQTSICSFIAEVRCLCVPLCIRLK